MTTTRHLSIPLTVALILALLATPAAPASAAVILASFDAKALSSTAALLAWNTDSEEGNVGFYVYRRPVRDTDAADEPPIAFVPSAAPPSGLGASYRFTDTVPGPGAYLYWLADLDKAGNVTDHPGAIVEIEPEPPTAVSLVSLDASAQPLATQRSSCYVTGRYPVYVCRCGRVNVPMWVCRAQRS